MIVTQKNRQFLPSLLDRNWSAAMRSVCFYPGCQSLFWLQNKKWIFPKLVKSLSSQKQGKYSVKQWLPLLEKDKYLIKEIIPLMLLQHSDTQTFFFTIDDKKIKKNRGLKVECQEWKTKIDSKLATTMMDMKPISWSLGVLHRRPPPGGNKD